ncbi:hypothetical protein EDWATA_01913 [Edwardsiella tarda ATCC 23685]|uniref:Uncharacterized protein n=1 Tax=Edwardsiella tarda ATCC 23685 TaxID=500638 RepID=D4F585_EDWTA|nr:hypothetical protein EDWATA_01913 [Edwardsiella tarda ATCC 23685]
MLAGLATEGAWGRVGGRRTKLTPEQWRRQGGLSQRGSHDRG